MDVLNLGDLGDLVELEDMDMVTYLLVFSYNNIFMIMMRITWRPSQR